MSALWARKGAAAPVVADDRKSVILYGLVLAVRTLLVTGAASATGAGGGDRLDGPAAHAEGVHAGIGPTRRRPRRRPPHPHPPGTPSRPARRTAKGAYQRRSHHDRGREPAHEKGELLPPRVYSFDRFPALAND
ncbi:hypothetical protein [Streptomyces sp. CA-253872]|uniref:hypothetical protein n=1 Tax=Streptomyces sp. CA-253872 TaxID=3240067 RepID=UPI003D8C7EDB